VAQPLPRHRWRRSGWPTAPSTTPSFKQITQLVARDEARHVSFGVLSLDHLYDQMATAERAEREELILDAASLMRRRFLLEDVWDRLDVDTRDGVENASTDQLMVKYWQGIFATVVFARGQVGLMTERVRDGLERLDLLGFASGRALAGGTR